MLPGFIGRFLMSLFGSIITVRKNSNVIGLLGSLNYEKVLTNNNPFDTFLSKCFLRINIIHKCFLCVEYPTLIGHSYWWKQNFYVIRYLNIIQVGRYLHFLPLLSLRIPPIYQYKVNIRYEDPFSLLEILLLEYLIFRLT